MHPMPDTTSCFRSLVLVLAAVLLATLAPLFARAQLTAEPALAVDAKIEIVWPHNPDGTQYYAGRATMANVKVYVFQRGTLDPVGCDFSNDVSAI